MPMPFHVTCHRMAGQIGSTHQTLRGAGSESALPDATRELLQGDRQLARANHGTHGSSFQELANGGRWRWHKLGKNPAFSLSAPPSCVTDKQANGRWRALDGRKGTKDAILVIFPRDPAGRQTPIHCGDSRCGVEVLPDRKRVLIGFGFQVHQMIFKHRLLVASIQAATS
jgi:hypothetical protein